MRRGASWTYHLQLTVAVVARPDGICPAERPADIQRSGIVALVDTARTPATASVAGRCPASGVPHPVSSSRCPAVQPSGIQPVRCPVTWVRRPGVRRSGRLRSTRPVSGPLVSTRPASAGWCPPRRSGCVRLLPYRAVALGPGRCGGHPSPREWVESRWACRAVERFGGRPSRPDASGAADSRVGQRGVGGGPGPRLDTAAAPAR